jgi:hypothetical protein
MLQCARSKVYKSGAVPMKLYASTMTGCPWRAKMVPCQAGGWKVTQMCAEHNHSLNDELHDKGMPPRARTTPSKGARALASAVDRSDTPPSEPFVSLQADFLPVMSSWPTITASGIKVYSEWHLLRSETDVSHSVLLCLCNSDCFRHHGHSLL